MGLVDKRLSRIQRTIFFVFCFGQGLPEMLRVAVPGPYPNLDPAPKSS